ncbi:MAG: phycobiliprotein lyase [Cyanobacteria bacterium P01_G01_bin.54]
MQTLSVSPTTHPLSPLAAEQIKAFLQETVGEWHSQRRYYTLDKGVVQEVESLLSVRFLEAGSELLQELAGLHGLASDAPISCGTQVTWESTYPNTSRKPAVGSTIFGEYQGLLLRDRGFATPKPVTATYTFPSDRTLCLRTEYKGSKFEEEVKLIGTQYRTRQSIISRAGQEIMIGQYLEKRI